MNYDVLLKEKLLNYRSNDIIITNHAMDQALFRNINITEIKQNILNPKRLTFAGKQQSKDSSQEKYDCYFVYSKTQCHRYILVINSKCVVCTVIKINRRWQYVLEKYKKV